MLDRNYSKTNEIELLKEGIQLMSGGHFDYQYYHFDYIAEDIDEYINGHKIDEDDVERYINDRDLDDFEKEYVRKQKHTIPNYYGYKDEVVEKIKEGLDVIRKAYVYAKRIDYLLSGDDGEASFLSRLQKDLKTLKIMSDKDLDQENKS